MVSLRDHYALGRLTLDELDERVELALRARSRAALRRSLTALPDPRGRAVVRATVRGAVLLLLTWTWFAFSFALLVVFGLTLLIHGATAVEVFAFLLVWLVPTYLLVRLWRRSLPRWTWSP